MIRLLTGCAAMLLAGAAAGQIFECVDAKGHREFAQFCPPGTVKETRLGGAAASKPATSPAPAAEQKPPAERQGAEVKADKDKEKAQSKEAVKSGASASKPATSPASTAGQKPLAERQGAEAKAEKDKVQSKEAVKGGAVTSKPVATPAPATGQKPPAERHEPDDKAEKGKAQSKEAVKGAVSASKPATSPAPGPKSMAEREADFRKRMLERKEAEAKAEKAEKEKAEANAEAERNCYDARSRLRALQEGFPVRLTDPNTGARSLLENRDRPAETATAQKAVDNWCNKK